MDNPEKTPRPFEQVQKRNLAKLQREVGDGTDLKFRPYKEVRRRNLMRMLEQAGGPTALMRMSGTTDTHLTACVNTERKFPRAVGDDMATTLEAAMMAAGFPGWTWGSMDIDPDGPSAPPPEESAAGALFGAQDAPTQDLLLQIMRDGLLENLDAATKRLLLRILDSRHIDGALAVASAFIGMDASTQARMLAVMEAAMDPRLEEQTHEEEAQAPSSGPTWTRPLAEEKAF